MKLLIALQFLTRIPITLRGSISPNDMGRSMAFFPAVGLMLGVFTAAIHTLLAAVLSPPVCDLLAVVFLVFITGNMHGDGLMDTADGLFSGRQREGMLEIMKDSRVGSHGVMAGSMVLLAKFVFLGAITLSTKGLALILVPALGRWAQVYGAAVYPYARKEGGTASFTAYVGFRQMFWASATVLTAIILLLGVPGIVLAGTVLAGTAGMGWYISGKIGGMTGDTLGAMTECIEVLTLGVLIVLF